MKNNNKRWGLSKEREVKKIIEKQGAMTVRSRGSFGNYDLICFFSDKCKLISVKATKKKYFSFSAECVKLQKVKLPSYCEGELWVWLSPRADRKRKGWIILPYSEIMRGKK